MTKVPGAATLSDEQLLETAQLLLDQATHTARSYFRAGIGFELKHDASPVTIADQQIERAARQLLESRHPGHAILGEEYGAGDLRSEHLWVLDPIDGTRSFISGHPLYGVLLAYLERGECRLGAVAMPELGENFIGLKGASATLNGQAIAAAQQTELARATIYLNEFGLLFDQHPELGARLLRLGEIRRLSHDCYAHALLAAGHVDVVVDFDLKPFDYLPLVGLIEAAGGVISDWHGQPLNYESDGNVLSAATPALHAQMIEQLRLA